LQLQLTATAQAAFDVVHLFRHTLSSLYDRVVVIKAPLQGLCYTARNAVDWRSYSITRCFKKDSNHSFFLPEYDQAL